MITIKALDQSHVRILRQTREQKKTTEKKIQILTEEITLIENQLIECDNIQTLSSLEVFTYHNHIIINFTF